MKKIFPTIVLFQIIACSNEGLFFEDAYVIENVGIIDPIDGLELNMSVVIKENKILDIFKTREIVLSPKNKVHKGTNKFIIPGLWDSHIHFAFEKDLATSMPNLFLYHGITSLRDTGGEFDFVNKFKQEAISNPKTKSRVKIAGPLIDGKFNVYDGSNIYFPKLSIQNIDNNQLERNVRLLIDKKVDFLKAYEMLSPAQFKILSNLAKENNLKLTGHVPLSMSVIEASNLGLNSMEHLRNLELSMTEMSEKLFQERKNLLLNKSSIKGSELRSLIHSKQRMKSINDLDSIKINNVIDALIKNDVWQIPTLILYKNFANKTFKNPDYLQFLNLLPEERKEEWIKKINAIDNVISTDVVEYTVWSKKMVDFMHDRGISFMAGTDTPIGFLIPGLSLHQEIQELYESGLSELEAIQTATINPAKYFNLENSLGRIKSGFIADLIILDKNPLESISNTKSIHAVIKEGNLMNRSYLDSLMK
ncbi:MAG: amidohydrolase family protein [Flavobacteriaceae bacterium]|nr:amidohydrolase family protein [Flavobacteriaceae bacterium]